MQSANKIPVYSLDSFRKQAQGNVLFQVERFDANRHFQVAYPHRHDFYEVLFLTQGSGKHIIDTNEYNIEPPCLFFLSPGQAHKLLLSQDVDGYIFLFTSEFYAKHDSSKNQLLEFPFFFSISQQNPPLYLQDKKDAHFISELFVKAAVEYEKKTTLYQEIIHSILHLILVSCHQLYSTENTFALQNRQHVLVRKFLLLLEESYSKNLSIDFYAKKLAISPNHFSQIVKTIIGRTPISIIHERRVVEIKRLLLHSNMSIAEISDYMQFSDQSYFTKFFKKHTKKTPLQYKKSESKEF